jgi:small subunit ribosomal protein S9
VNKNVYQNVPNNKKARGTGRRKSSVARVEITSGTGNLNINKMPAIQYMQKNTYLMVKIQAPLAFLDLKNQFNFSIFVQGGGLVGQADAIQLGISNALCAFKQMYRTPLKLKGYLTSDARVKERKKYGLKKARKAPQYSKR